MDKLAHLKELNNNKNWQKFCTGEDWSDPCFRYVLHEIFQNNSAYNRKQWEFVVIFLSLFNQGKLNESSKGASFGAGKEPLIYDLLPHVGSLFATDLYSLSTGWETAKLNDKETPLQFIKNSAPKGLNTDNLTAQDMDMRHLDIEDKSLDFCYSSCAIEHIGHMQDFIRHFSEVARVLKNDGVYVVTTELLFGHPTVKNKHNYKFSLKDLQEIFIQSGLNAQPSFDANCEESLLNSPRPFLRPLIDSESLYNILAASPILEFEGIPYTSCNFILTKNSGKSQTFKASGLKSSTEFVYSKMKKNMLNLYKDNRSLNPFQSLIKQNRIFLDDHFQYRVINNKKTIKLIDPKFCFTDFIWFDNNKAQFTVAFKLIGYKGKIIWFLMEKDQLNIANRNVIERKVVMYKPDTNLQQLTFKFSAQSKKVYAVRAQISLNLFKKRQINLVIDYLHVSAQMQPNLNDVIVPKSCR